MAGFAQQKAELDEQGIAVIAASVDSLEHASEVAATVNFPLAWGVDKDIADTIGAWWEERRQIIQPSAFVLNPEGSVVQSSYSSGPLARLEADDVVKLVGFLKKN